MRAGQAGPALGMGRLGRSSNCSSFCSNQGRCGSNYNPLWVQHPEAATAWISHHPLLHYQTEKSKIQATALCRRDTRIYGDRAPSLQPEQLPRASERFVDLIRVLASPLRVIWSTAAFAADNRRNVLDQLIRLEFRGGVFRH